MVKVDLLCGLGLGLRPVMETSSWAKLDRDWIRETNSRGLRHKSMCDSA